MFGTERSGSRGSVVVRLAALALGGVVACQTQNSDDDLQALLRDGDLTHLASGALTAATGGAAGSGRVGAGGANGGGTAGNIGSTDGGIIIVSGDAGRPMTGAGGFIGSTGGTGGFIGCTGGTGGFIGSTGGTGGFIGGAGGFIGGTGGFIGAGGSTGTGGFCGGTGGFIGRDGGFASDAGPGSMCPPPFLGPFGRWSFDDCNSQRTNLFDSGPNGNTAFRAVNVACGAGVAGQAVMLAAQEDIVYVPDQPMFTFERGVTVAGWFNPTAVNKTRTLFRKRDKDTSSFALVLNGGKFQFVVNLGEGRAASVTAPKKAKVGVFQHVAGTYDGNMLNLYVDGALVTNFPVAGSIPPGPGPLLMGNDGSERRFDGSIDNTFFDGRALSADEVMQLTCIRQPATSQVVPRVSAPTPAGTSASFDIAITNHNSPSCAPDFYTFEEFNFLPGIDVQPPPFSAVSSPPVPSGATTHFTMTATPSEDVDPGTFPLFFEVFSTDPSFFLSDSVQLVVAEPTGCHVSTSRELMIKNLSVVDDQVRTGFGSPSSDPRTGAWTFKHLVENMAPSPADAPDMVEQMLSTFTTTTTVNGFALAPRPGMQTLILNSWPRTPDGRLDLSRAPLRLQAIVNRFDLRNLGNGDAGEGRFVFAFNSPDGFFPLQATMIFEYKLPATTEADVAGWASSWHALGALKLGDESYNAALQAITDRFTARGARPDHPNGNAINAVRTNEIDFGDNGIWQLREFDLSADTGRLVPSTIKLTPDRGFDNTDTLASFINQNQAAIIAETHTVPETFAGQPFLAGAVFNPLTTWRAPGVDPEARFHFAVNTCNGCHSEEETGVVFLQISPRFPGSEAQLSGFLTGTMISDPVTGTAAAVDGQPAARDLARPLT